jgi:hypothetical protein
MQAEMSYGQRLRGPFVSRRPAQYSAKSGFYSIPPHFVYGNYDPASQGLFLLDTDQVLYDVSNKFQEWLNQEGNTNPTSAWYPYPYLGR